MNHLGPIDKSHLIVEHAWHLGRASGLMNKIREVDIEESDARQMAGQTADMWFTGMGLTGQVFTEEMKERFFFAYLAGISGYKEWRLKGQHYGIRTDLWRVTP